MLDLTPTVLIVDDSDDCAETLELAFHGMSDIRIAVAHSAEEALEHVSAGNIAALVTDLHLPQMDGLHLLSEWRTRNNGHYTPVLVISGDSDPRTPARVLEAGAQAYFAKPYSPAAVRRKLEELLVAGGRNGSHGSPKQTVADCVDGRATLTGAGAGFEAGDGTARTARGAEQAIAHRGPGIAGRAVREEDR